MRPTQLSLGVAAALGGALLFPVSQASANGESACDDECVVELRELIDAQQRQLQQQAEMLNALQARVESIAAQGTAPVVGGAKNEPGVVKSGNDKVKLTASGQVNRGVLITDDGEETDVFYVDNDHSSTRINLKGEAKPFANGPTIGAEIEVEYKSNSTAAVNQEDQSVTSNSFNERKLEVYIDSPLAGRVALGQGSTASDNSSEVDLSGTGVIGTSDMADFAGGMLFRDADTGDLTTTRIGSTFSNEDGLGRDDRIRYDSPSFSGFQFATSFITDDKWDAVLRYSGDFGAVKTAAAIAYADPNTSGFDNRLNGSASVLHSSGVSVTAAAGRDDRDDRDPGFWYIKLGYQTQFSSLGKTAFAIDYYSADDIAVEGDESTAYGVYAVQNLDDYATELYLGARNYELERRDENLDDIFAVLTGARVKF